MKQIKNLIVNINQLVKIDLNDYKIESLKVFEFDKPNVFTDIPEEDIKKSTTIYDFSNSNFGPNFKDNVKNFLLKKDIKKYFFNINQYKNYYEDICFSYLAFLLTENQLSSLKDNEYNYLISMCPYFATYLAMYIEKDEKNKKNLENIILNNPFKITVYYAIKYKKGPWKELEETENYKKENKVNSNVKMTYLQKNIINYGINSGKTLEQVFTEMVKNKTYNKDLNFIFKNNLLYDTINILFKKQYFKQLDDYIYENHYELYNDFYKLLKRRDLEGDFNLEDIEKRLSKS